MALFQDEATGKKNVNITRDRLLSSSIYISLSGILLYVVKLIDN